eukprot:m.72343 g.72343  ORF g.72343 m.72343 type:complete len:71 (-) comp24446_c1_seq1:95-307(-)
MCMYVRLVYVCACCSVWGGCAIQQKTNAISTIFRPVSASSTNLLQALNLNKRTIKNFGKIECKIKSYSLF